VRGTILCVDDDRHFCQILSRAFAEEGYAVETAHDGETGLRKARELAPSLVTLDVMLPRRDGFSVLEALRTDHSELKRTPVILVSGCTFTPDYEQRARQLAANAVLRKPIPLDRLLGEVARQMSAQRPAASEPRAALQGSLSELPVAELLHQLHGMRANGVLEVVDGKKKKQVQLREGAPVAVRSNLVDETLGSLLVASGRITPDVLHHSLARVKQGEGLHGQILVAMHMLDEEDLARALRHQADEKLFELFAWTQGGFRFHRGARLKGGNALSLKRAPADVILRGARERVPAALVERFLDERADRVVTPGEKPFYHFQDVALDGAAKRILQRVDGSRPVRGLCVDEDDRRTLYGLLTIELLELRPREAAACVRDDAPADEPAASPWNEERRVGAERAEARAREDLAQLAQRFEGLDAFGVLGVKREATDAEIRAAYTELAKRTHPDRFTGASSAVLQLAEQVFGRISAAYEEIGTLARRTLFFQRERAEAKDAEAREEGSRALQAEAEFQKGEAALRAKRVEQAHAHFQKAVELFPEEGEYHALLGWSYYLTAPEREGRVQQALEHVQRGRKLAPDRDLPCLLLGRLMLASGRAEVAEKMFSRAVQLNPDNVEALRELRLLHTRRARTSGLVGKILRRG
jgi:CheY-like chemotaxis protein/tetratricopeptide (TPR) repeat protein